MIDNRRLSRNGAPKTATHAEAYQHTYPKVGGEPR